MVQPQLQAGHWYLVHAEDGHGSIRAYMADGGWHPAHPTPLTVVCEMSRVEHPDNVQLGEDGEDFTVTDMDQLVIEHHCPPAASEPLLARAIRAMAERLCIASGQDWDPNWTWDQDTEPEITKNRHVAFLMIACDLTNQAGGDNPAVRDWDDVVAALGPLEGIFRPKRWPAETLPDAVPLPHAS
jgi:hypothetical protein